MITGILYESLDPSVTLGMMSPQNTKLWLSNPAIVQQLVLYYGLVRDPPVSVCNGLHLIVIATAHLLQRTSTMHDGIQISQWTVSRTVTTPLFHELHS